MLATPSESQAFPFNRRNFQAAYGKSTGCALCHGYGGNTQRNPYGETWQRAGENTNAFRRVEAEDSDGDGVSNLQEIQEGSNPGDPRSLPGKPGRAWLRDINQVPIPLEQLELVFGAVDRVDALEVELTKPHREEIEERLGRPLLDHEVFPTLYLATQEGERTTVALFGEALVREDRYSVLVSAGGDARLKRSLIFRAGSDAGSAFLPFLKCLSGYPSLELPAPGERGCPIVPGRKKAQVALIDAIRAALTTASVLLADRTLASPAPRHPADPEPVSDQRSPEKREESAPPRLDLQVATTASVNVMSPVLATTLTLLAAAFLIALIVGSSGLAVRRWGRAVDRDRLRDAPAAQKLLVTLVLLSLLSVQALAAADAYVQTQLVHGSVRSYFQYLTWARLLGTSHAHVFGYAILYGLVGYLLSLSSARPLTKCALIATMLWAGIFDVLSWWAIKGLSPRFEWLTNLTGAAVSISCLISVYLTMRSVWARPAGPEAERSDQSF